MADSTPKTIASMYKQMRHLEKKYVVQENYLARQHKIDGGMRAILMDWLVDVVKNFNLLEETLQMTVAIIDRYLQIATAVESTDLQLIGITALWVASKYEEVCSMYISDLIFVSAYTYTKAQLVEYERKMLFTLRFNLTRPVPLNFLIRFTTVSNSSQKEQHLAEYFVNLSLVEYCMAHYKPSEVAAAAVCLSLYLLSGQDGKTLATVWTDTLVTESRYKLDDIEPIVIKIAKIVTEVSTSGRKSVINKFSRTSYSKVAHLPELKGPALQQLALRAEEEALVNQFVQVPIQSTTVTVQSMQAQLQAIHAPIQAVLGPSQAVRGPNQVGPRKRQACPAEAAPEPKIPASRRKVVQQPLDDLDQVVMVEPNDPAEPVATLLIPVTIQYILVPFPEQF